MFKIYQKELSPIVGHAGFNAYPTIRSLASVFDDLYGSYTRQLSLAEEDDYYTLTLELPGFKKEEVDVTLDNQFLVIKAKNAKSEVSKTLDLALWEIDFSKIDARLENGLLTITLSKTERAKPSKIEIK